MKLKTSITILAGCLILFLFILLPVILSIQEKHDWHRGQFFMMIRLAVTGRKATPPLFETMDVLGKEKVLARLKKAIAQIS